MAERYDLAMEQGSRFSLAFTYYDDQIDPQTGEVVLDADGNPVPGDARDFTGWTGRMQVRKTYATPILINAEGPPEIYLGTAGEVLITIGADKTDNLIETSGSRIGQAIRKGVYDLEIVDNGDPTNVERVVQGIVNVEPNATRES